MPKEKRKPLVMQGWPDANERQLLVDDMSVVTPILTGSEEKKIIRNLGSGFYVDIAGKHFLVTAAHVLHDSIGSGLPIIVPGRGGPLIRLKEEHFDGTYLATSAAKDRATDRFDVGIIKLKQRLLPPFGEKGLPAPSCLLASDRLPRQMYRYWAVGFPTSKSDINIPAHSYESPAYAPINLSPPNSTYRALGLKPQNHILMNFDRRRSFDANLQPVQELPDPHGMSGGAMFVVDDGGRYGAKLVRLVGVLTEYLKDDKLMVATDIRIALNYMTERRAPAA